MSVNTPDSRPLLDVTSDTDNYIMPRGNAEREQEARAAAELMYNANITDSQNPPVIRVTSQTNGIHPPPPPVQGAESPYVDQNGFSGIRRVFCLLATFDLVLTAVLWFIFIQLSGLVGLQGFICQIEEYNFGYSLFDLVAMALFRMLVLLFAYALFKSKHWIFVTITTVATSGLIVSKIFIYDFMDTSSYPEGCRPKSSNSLMSIVIIICSLIIAWLELWVFSFQVIPRENKILEDAHAARLRETDERRPLLDPHTNRRYDLPGGQKFYSPVDSPRDSDTESTNSENSSASFKSTRTADFQSLPNSQRGSTVDLAASAGEQEYIQKAKEALVILQGILDNTEIWKEESAEGDGAVFCGTYPGISTRLYKLDCIIPVSPETLVELIWDKCHESASWNSALLDAEIVQHINPSVDILYSVAAPGGRGVFSSRDFVTVRLYEQRGERFVSSAIAVEHPDKPPVSQYVRGQNGVSGWVIEPVPDKPGHCRYIWIINSDIKLKVWTPQNIMDPVMAGVIMNSHRDLLNHLSRLQDTAES